MMKFLDIVEKEIPTFNGIYYDHTVKCDEIVLLKHYKPEKIHICGTNVTSLSPIIEGLDVVCIAMTNLYPDLITKL